MNARRFTAWRVADTNRGLIRALGAALITAGMALSGPAGCTAPNNTRATLGESTRLSTFTPAAELPKPTTSSEPLTSASREHWAPMVVIVPVDPVHHRPNYRVDARCAQSQARQRGEYPTVATATELCDEDSCCGQTLEGFASPFYAALDIVLWIPRAFGQGPFTRATSPQTGYERSPRRTPATTEASATTTGPEAPMPHGEAAAPEPTPARGGE